VLIYKFVKNALEEIRCEITTFQDKGYISLRVWFDSSKGQNLDWRPSQKGLTVSVDLIPELTKALALAAGFLGNEKILAGPDEEAEKKAISEQEGEEKQLPLLSTPIKEKTDPVPEVKKSKKKKAFYAGSEGEIPF